MSLLRTFGATIRLAARVSLPSVSRVTYARTFSVSTANRNSVFSPSYTTVGPIVAVKSRYLASLAQPDVEARVLKIVKGFERVDANKVTLTSHFIDQLGLDSLDAVELVMAFEDEFGLHIPDADAETILTPEKAVQYILNNQDKIGK